MDVTGYRGSSGSALRNAQGACNLLAFAESADYANISLTNREESVSGATLATVVSQLLSALACLGAAVLRHRNLLFRSAHLRLEPVFVRRTFSVSLVTALRQSSIYLGKILAQGTVNSQGLNLISANFTKIYTLSGQIS